MKSRSVSRVETPEFGPGESTVRRLKILISPGFWRSTDPFILMGEDIYKKGAFENHPHRGLETITYVVKGKLSHYDNLGNRGEITEGEALWMTSGRGIVHNEIPVDDKAVHIFQLWLNLPKKDKFVEANYQELKKENVPKRTLPGAEVFVFSGFSGDVTSPTRNYVQMTMIEVRLEPFATFEQELPEDTNGFVLILEGEGTVGTTSVERGNFAWLEHEQEKSMVKFQTGQTGVRLLLYGAKPLREPMVAQGPFVMNSSEEIQQAFVDYHRDKERFGLQ